MPQLGYHNIAAGELSIWITDASKTERPSATSVGQPQRDRSHVGDGTSGVAPPRMMEQLGIPR
jgi:hypothetical protein